MPTSSNMGFENISFSSDSQYRVVQELARGGMGIIFLAEKYTSGIADSVVLKTLRSINDEEEQKFKEEAEIATFLRHENIVKTYGMEQVVYSELPVYFQNLICENTNDFPLNIQSHSLDNKKKRTKINLYSY